MAKGKTSADYEAEYTEPELRERLKEEIKASDRGGRAGRWTARKSQLLVKEYEKAGGGYKHPEERTASQRHLREWGEQEWQTKEGDVDARGEDGTSRYLPEVAWKLLSKAEREATDQRKTAGDEQRVENTRAAQEARRAAELLTLDAAEARKRVTAMEGRSQLERARTAEERFGKARKTVLDAIGRRLAKEG